MDDDGNDDESDNGDDDEDDDDGDGKEMKGWKFDMAKMIMARK